MSPPIPSSLTLYPKITQHIHEVVKKLKREKRDPNNPDEQITLSPMTPIPIIGTVKLHGTHADILIYASETIIFQSRNNPNLLATSDNFSFASTMSSKTATILHLRDQYLRRWKDLNPSASLDSSHPIMIAGEWIGEKIQKDVAISNLSKRFVTVSVRINNAWVPDTDYADIEAPEDDIYNISRGGVYRSILYPENLQQTVEELEQLAEKVAARCPFAESFGVVGQGEGLVWKLESCVEKEQLWFKTKGGHFRSTFAPKARKLGEGDALKREVAAEAAKAWCGKLRLDQGWDYLREKGITRDMKGIASFLKWVEQDILVEEKGYIQEQKVDKQMLKGEIVAIAKPWFLERYRKDEE